MSQTNMSVLYDAPGPRQRKITWISSVIATLGLLAAAYFLIYKPLDDRGQFSMELWGPFIDPANENFNLLWKRVGTGFGATLLAAALAILSSLLCGTLLAVLRIQLKSLKARKFAGFGPAEAFLLRGLNKVLSVVTRFCVEVFRGLPVVITIFFVARGLPTFGINLDAVWFLVIGLTIYNMVVIAEILRSGMEGLPSGQAEAANALGLSPLQTTRLILLPQSFRIMLPALISQLVVILKDTSLGFIISYEDTLNIAKQVVGVLENPIQTYFVIGVMFVAINYSLSRLAVYTERRLARGRSTASLPAPDLPSTAITAQAGGGASGV